MSFEASKISKYVGTKYIDFLSLGNVMKCILYLHYVFIPSVSIRKKIRAFALYKYNYQ